MLRTAALAALLALSACGASDAPGNRDGGNAIGPAAAPQAVPQRPLGTEAGAPTNSSAAVSPPAPAESRSMSPSGYALTGTEPFWGGTVTGTRVRYMTPDRQFGDVVETRVSYGAGGTETYSGTFRGRPFVLTLTRQACSDGMSDRSYAFAATLQVLGETRRGCADPE